MPNTLEVLERDWQHRNDKVVCLRAQWAATAAAGKDLLTSLTEWKIKSAAHEVASGDRISEPERVATIMDHAPEPGHLWTNESV